MVREMTIGTSPDPYGYRVRYALPWHSGGWKPCAGLPACNECRQIVARRDAAISQASTYVVDELERKKVALRILNIGVDTSKPTGRLVLQVLG